MIDIATNGPQLIADNDSATVQEQLQRYMKVPNDQKPHINLHTDELGRYYTPYQMPIVVIVNGTARSGKDTFVDICEKTYSDEGYYPACVRLSSVDLCYKAINDVLLKNDTRQEVKAAIDTKSDAWRQFMHELKMSWSKFCNGPTQYIINQLNQYTESDNTPAFVFMFLREPSEIKTLVDALKICGYLTLTVFITGNVKNTFWENECDKNVVSDAYPYDVLINNLSDLDEYRSKCRKFMLQLISFRNTARNLPMYRKYVKTKTQ